VILAFNHIAYLDPFAAAYLADSAGRPPRFLAKSELFGDRRIAWLLRALRQIEVRRGTADAPMALDKAFAALRRGECVVIFPEGTLTTDPDLDPMAAKSGIARLALGSGAPIVPCALWGTANVWTKGHAKRFRPRQDICVNVGSPMTVTGDPRSPEDWERVGAEVMAQISLLLASLRPVLPDRRRPKRAA